MFQTQRFFHFGLPKSPKIITLSDGRLVDSFRALHFADDILVPDLAGWRRTRMSTVPTTAYFTQAPDWVCEVLSPETAGLDRQRKLSVYARESVPHTWLLDPVQQTLEVLRRERRQLGHRLRPRRR